MAEGAATSAGPPEDPPAFPSQGPRTRRPAGTTSRPGPVASPDLEDLRSYQLSAVPLRVPDVLDRDGREHTHHRHL